MYRLLKIGEYDNIATNQYYVESESEVDEIKDAPVGSIVLILTDSGLSVKMLHSNGKWIEI